VPAWVWAAAGVVLLFSTVTSYQARQTAHRLAELQTEAAKQRKRSASLQAERERTARLIAILSASATRLFTLAPAKPDLPALTVYWNERLGFVLSMPGAPDPGVGFIYQLWLVPREGDPVSLTLFPPRSGELEVYVFAVVAEFAGVQALAVTEEPAGGSPRPTVPPLWRAQVSPEPRPIVAVPPEPPL